MDVREGSDVDTDEARVLKCERSDVAVECCLSNN